MEQRVVVIMPDLPEFIISWLAAVKIGAVVNTINPLYPAEDYPAYFKHLRPAVLVLHDSAVDKLAAVIPEFPSSRHVIVVGEKREGFLLWCWLRKPSMVWLVQVVNSRQS